MTPEIAERLARLALSMHQTASTALREKFQMTLAAMQQQGDPLYADFAQRVDAVLAEFDSDATLEKVAEIVLKLIIASPDDADMSALTQQAMNDILDLVGPISQSVSEKARVNE